VRVGESKQREGRTRAGARARAGLNRKSRSARRFASNVSIFWYRARHTADPPAILMIGVSDRSRCVVCRAGFCRFWSLENVEMLPHILIADAVT